MLVSLGPEVRSQHIAPFLSAAALIAVNICIRSVTLWKAQPLVADAPSKFRSIGERRDESGLVAEEISDQRAIARPDAQVPRTTGPQKPDLSTA
jgi:hypothetical protein